MHIVYLTSEFVTGKTYGGLATYLDNISSIMSDKGHEITIITLSDHDKVLYRNKIKVINVRGLYLYSSELARGLSQIYNSWNIYCILMKLSKQIKIDIVQSTSLDAVGLFRSFKIPTVVRISSDSAMCRHAMEKKFDLSKAMLEKTWTDKLQLSVIKYADRVFAPSKCSADIVRKRSKRKVTVIESPFKIDNTRRDDKLYEQKLKGKQYLLLHSSLSYLKGTHIMIDATEEILNKYSDLTIVYAGIDKGFKGIKTPIEEILKIQNKKYPERVIYLKKLSHEQLFPIIEKALACVLPSRIDNLPNSCIEAMSLSKIVIGTYGASFEQLIKNKENGLLIKRDSVKGLIKAVDYLMNMTSEEKFLMGRKAKDTVMRLSPEIIYEKLIGFYESVINEKEGKRRYG